MFCSYLANENSEYTKDVFKTLFKAVSINS